MSKWKRYDSLDELYKDVKKSHNGESTRSKDFILNHSKKDYSQHKKKYIREKIFQ